MAVKSKRTKSGLGGCPNRPVKHEQPREQTVTPDSETELPDIINIALANGEIADDIRETVRAALKDSAKNISKWLADVGEEQPARALALYKDMMEYLVPRMQRTDSKIDPSSPVNVIFELTDSYEERKAAEAKLKAEIAEKQPIKIIPKDDFF